MLYFHSNNITLLFSWVEIHVHTHIVQKSYNLIYALKLPTHWYSLSPKKLKSIILCIRILSILLILWKFFSLCLPFKLWPFRMVQWRYSFWVMCLCSNSWKPFSQMKVIKQLQDSLCSVYFRWAVNAWKLACSSPSDTI